MAAQHLTGCNNDLDRKCGTTTATASKTNTEKTQTMTIRTTLVMVAAVSLVADLVTTIFPHC